VLKVRFADDVIVSFAGRLVPLKGNGLNSKQAVISQAVTKRALGFLAPDRGELVARARHEDRDASRWSRANEGGVRATTIGAQGEKQKLQHWPIRMAVHLWELRNVAVPLMRRALAAARRQNRDIHAEYLRSGRGPKPGVVEGVLSRYKARGSGE